MVMTEIKIIISLLIWFVVGFVSMYMAGRYYTGGKLPKKDQFYVFLGGVMGLISTGLCIIFILLDIIDNEIDKIKKDI